MSADESIEIFSIRHRVGSQAISWAGLCPWTSSPCFGLESGDVAILNADRRINRRHFILKTGVGDPVNGIAFRDDFMCVTSRTRTAVALKHGWRPDLAPAVSIRRFEFGAHGGTVSSKPYGGFLLPLGADGFAQIKVEGRRARIVSRTIVPVADELHYCYRMARLASDGEKDVIATANRKAGIVRCFATDDETEGVARIFRFPDQDVIDVVPVRDARLPFGVVGLTTTGNFCFVPDARHPTPKSAVLASSRSSSAYSLLIVQGHGVVLTDGAVQVIPEFVDHLVRGLEKRDWHMGGHTLAANWFEVFPCGDEAFFAIEDDDAFRVPIQPLIETLRGTTANKGKPSVPGRGFGTATRKLLPINSDRFELSDTGINTNLDDIKLSAEEEVASEMFAVPT